MADYLFEIYSEEIPSRFQKQACIQIQELFHNHLLQAQLTYAHIQAFITHRRFGVHIEGLPEKQPDYTLEKRGPREDADKKAIHAFANSAGVAVEQLTIKSTDKGSFYFFTKQHAGELVSHLLTNIAQSVMQDFVWPKSMRWNQSVKSWVRPIHHGLSILNGEPLSFHLDMGGGVKILFGNSTKGHPFLAPDYVAVDSYADYIEQLRHRFVFVDWHQRRDYISHQIKALADNHGLIVTHDDELLSEVCGMVEFPVPLLGKIDENFMDLPEELLITVMRHHQRYFAVKDQKGKLAPCFIVVANTVCEDGGALIVEGNQRVLRARLNDARFFFDQDRTQSLDSFNEKLCKMTFHASLGSMMDRVDRLKTLTSSWAKNSKVDPEKIQRAAYLCKADLGTSMVYEFPELQGIMGRYYAHAEDADIARAIEEHYLPTGVESPIPESQLGKVLALADKIDTLVGFFGVGIRPTGSKDPFALRRAALGLIRICESDDSMLTIQDMVQSSCGVYAGHVKLALDTEQDVLKFIKERITAYWADQGIRKDIIGALGSFLATQGLGQLRKKAVVLQVFCSSSEGVNLLQGFGRAYSIVEQQKRMVPFGDMDTIHENLLEFPAEKMLAEAVRRVEKETQGQSFENQLKTLAAMRAEIDGFLNTVMVNDPNDQIRLNRLAVLNRVVFLMMKMADFSVIQVQ